MSKLFYVLGFVVTGIIAAVIREISRASRRSSQGNLINKLDRDPDFASEIVESLDLPYGRIKFSQQVFDVLKERMSSLTFLGPYKILRAIGVGNDCILIFTELSFADFQITVGGKADDVKEKAFHNFSLRYDQTSGEMTLRSDDFSDTTNKFQKEEFFKCLKELDK